MLKNFSKVFSFFTLIACVLTSFLSPAYADQTNKPSAVECLSKGYSSGNSNSKAAYCLSVTSAFLIGGVQAGRYALDSEVRNEYSLIKTFVDAYCTNNMMSELAGRMEVVENIVNERGHDTAYDTLIDKYKDKEVEVKGKEWGKDILPDLIKIRVNESKQFYAFQGLARVLTIALLDKDITNSKLAEESFKEAKKTLCISGVQDTIHSSGAKSMISPLTRNFITKDILGKLNSNISKYNEYTNAVVKVKVDGKSYIDNVVENVKRDVSEGMDEASNAGKMKALDIANRIAELFKSLSNNDLGDLPARQQIGIFDKNMSSIVNETKFFDNSTVIRQYGNAIGEILNALRKDYRMFVPSESGTTTPVDSDLGSTTPVEKEVPGKTSPDQELVITNPIVNAPITIGSGGNDKIIAIKERNQIALYASKERIDDNAGSYELEVKRINGTDSVAATLKVISSYNQGPLPIEESSYPVSFSKGDTGSIVVNIPVKDVDMTNDIEFTFLLVSNEAVVTLPKIDIVVEDAPRGFLDRLRRMKPTGK